MTAMTRGPSAARRLALVARGAAPRRIDAALESPGGSRTSCGPKGLGVVLEAEHLCMSLRGVQKLGGTTVTSALHELVRNDTRTRQEFLALTTRTCP